MKILKSKKLNKGDTIGLVALSGAVENISELEIAKDNLQKLGFKVVISNSCYKNYRDMAGTTKECLEALYEFFKDENIDVIMSVRGGYGTLRYLKDIDYSIIKNNPKIFIGYSDITNLLAMFLRKANLCCFYGPMALCDFALNFDEKSYTNMTNILQNNSKIISAENKKTLNSGIAEGILWGGNLSSLASMCGLDFIPDEEFILFMEDWNDPVYKLDRMFTQLMNIDKFKSNLKGIIFGEFLGVGKEEFLLWQKELIQTLNIPICEGFKITHGYSKLTLPIGVKVLFDADNGCINIKEEYLI